MTFGAMHTALVCNNVIAQNGAQGIAVSTNNNTISDNTVAFHTGQGIVVSSGTGNRISRNQIYSNGAIGIDLGTNGVSPNDTGDADTGANNLQNFPVITKSVNSGLTSSINGSLNSLPNQNYHLEFFSNDVCSTSGYGQGQNYIGATDVTTDASGNVNFTAQVGSLAVGNILGTNWSGTFYPSNDLTGAGVSVNNIQGLNFMWGTGTPIVNGVPVSGMPSDNFSARFTSTQTFAAGTYTFIVSSDDGVRVYVDGVIKLDKFVGRPLVTDTFATALNAGSHTLTVEYFDGLDQATLQVQWHLNGSPNGFVTGTATDANGNTSEFSACSPIQGVLGVGSYQENNENFAYSGIWVNYSGSGPLGGAYKYTNDPNGKVSFFVDSTVGRISLYRTTYTIYGSTQVFVDGVLVTTINNNSPTFLLGVPYTITITPGNHIIVLQNVGTTYGSVDQIDLLAPAAALSTGIYQETNVNLSYSGLWVPNSVAAALGGSRIYTSDPNASLSFNIDSSVARITLYRATYLAGVYGSLQVFLDNNPTPFVTINNTSATFTFGQPFTFSVTPGNHTVTIKNVGTTYSDIDQITLLAPPVPLSVGDYQETDTNLTYSGNWTPTSATGPSGGARIYTNDPNASVTFSVDSSVQRVIIYHTTYVTGVYGSMQVYLDGASTPFATIDNTSTAFTYGQPYTFAVAPGNHTIVIKNVGSTYSDIDQITLQAANPTFSVGTIQEDNVGLIFNGKWTSTTAPSNFRKYTNDPNGSVSFVIDNSVSRITLYRTTYLAGVYGSMQVFLDNNPIPFITINNTSSTFLYEQPFTFAVIPGSHVITLKNVGTTYSDIDQITLLPAAAPLGVGTYQETNTNLTYSGLWTPNNTPSAVGGSRIYTNDANGSVSFSINNTVGKVTIYRTTYLAGVYGSMQVFLDGANTPFATLDNTSASFTFGVPFTFAVVSGSHTITLKNVGSTYSDLDQIVLEAATPISTGTYQETDAALIYNGTWTPNATPSALGGSRKYTNDPNGSVSFVIDNSVSRITLYRTTYLAGVYGSMQMFLDNSAIPFLTVNNTSTSFLFGQPFTFAITPGNHVITLKNVGSTYSDLDQITLLSAAVPLGVGTYQETDTNLTYSGLWTPNSTASALGGSRTYTNDPNGSVSFGINNTVSKVTIYRTTYLAGIYGSMQVYLDGATTPFATINNTSSAFLFQQPFTFAVVPGSHTITLKNVGSTYSDLDQIVLEASTPLSTGTYQETDAALIYNGTWTPNTTPSALGGSRIYTNDSNGTVSFDIDNSVGRVTIYRTTYLAGVYGSMQVFIDNSTTPFTTMNNTSASFIFGVPFSFTVTPGNHVITLRNVGATYSDIDQIVLLPADTPLVVGIYQETNTNLIYSGLWTPNTTPSALGGSRIYTNDPNGSVIFSINNTVGKVTIYRTTYLVGVYGSMQVYLDGATTPFATLNNTSSAFLFQQPFTFAVVPGSHTITLKNVGSTYSDLDQIVLEGSTPLANGTYQETDAALIYNGIWTSNATPSALGGSRIYTNDPNGTVSFAINNTVGKVTIYRTTYTMYGSMQVYLDGATTPFATLNNTSSAFLFQQPYTFAVVPGSHTITLKNVGSTYSDLDQLVLEASTPLSTGTYQETNTALIYSGTWTPNAIPSALGGSRKYTNDPNGSVSFAVDNSVGRVTIYRTTYLAGVYGSMQVFIDNSTTPIATLNNTSAGFVFGVPFTLAVIPGSHTITLKNVGSTYSDLDQIMLQTVEPLTLGYHQETDANLIYNGNWGQDTVQGITRAYTNDSNGGVSFIINNTVGRVTIDHSLYLAGVYGLTQVSLDGAPAPFLTIDNDLSSQKLYQVE